MHIITFYHDICQHMQKALALVCVNMVLGLFYMYIIISTFTDSVCMHSGALNPEPMCKCCNLLCLLTYSPPHIAPSSYSPPLSHTTSPLTDPCLTYFSPLLNLLHLSSLYSYTLSTLTSLSHLTSPFTHFFTLTPSPFLSFYIHLLFPC